MPFHLSSFLLQLLNHLRHLPRLVVDAIGFHIVFVLDVLNFRLKTSQLGESFCQRCILGCDLLE